MLRLLVLFGVLISQQSMARVYTPAHIAVVPPNHINDLTWDNEFSRVRTEDSGAGVQYSVLFFGKYPREHWTLQYNNRVIVKNDRGGFRVEIAISKNDRFFEFEAIGPNGENEKEKIEINADFQELNGKPGYVKSSSLQLVPEKRFYVVPGLGVSMITYKQTAISDYKTTAITPKFAVNYRLLPHVWDLGFSTYFTAMQLSKSSTTTAQFLGLNLRLGYLVPNISTEWFLSIYGGWYYTTMFVKNDAFGYYNLSGPQIYPSIKRVLGNGDVAGFYFKYSPIASSFSLLTLSNREMAFGLSYTRLLPHEHSMGATFDYSTIDLTYDGAVTKTDTITFGVQYGM